MGIKQSHSLGGRLFITVNDLSENTEKTVRIDNRITVKGKTLLAEFLRGDHQEKPSLKIALGSGKNEEMIQAFETEESSDDTAGESHAPSFRKVEAIMKSIKAAGQDEAKVVAQIMGTLTSDDADGNTGLREAGIVVEIPGKPDILYNYVAFPVITHTEDISITFNWELTF